MTLLIAQTSLDYDLNQQPGVAPTELSNAGLSIARKENLNMLNLVAGTGGGAPQPAAINAPIRVVLEHAPARPTDAERDEEGFQFFKAAYALRTSPGVAKSVAVEAETVEPTALRETEKITGPESVTALIRKAQSSPSHIFELQRGYQGRAESAELAKAAAAQPRQVTNADFDKVSPELRRAVAMLDTMVKRAVERSLSKMA